MGPLHSESSRQFAVNNTQICDIEENLKQIYNQDFDDGGRFLDKDMSIEDKEAWHMMKSSITLKTGHFEISLPWRKDQSQLLNNKALAIQRLYMLKK